MYDLKLNCWWQPCAGMCRDVQKAITVKLSTASCQGTSMPQAERGQHLALAQGQSAFDGNEHCQSCCLLA